jgi:mannose-6-phosphate isomerase-like protein (cupin superfamily)
MRTATFTATLAATFVLGVCCARLVPAASAADAAPVPRIVSLTKITDEDLGAPRPGSTLRSQTLHAAPGATVAIQTGDAPKHFHANSDEIQYVIEGTGTIWLGDAKRDVGPGDLIIIPKGTTHGASVASSGRFKVLAIKTPPQAADDVHIVP